MEVRQIPRVILRGDTERASYRAREGMRQLNILKELMGFQKLEQDVRRVQYIDKSEIICKSTFGEETVEIYVPREEKGGRGKKAAILVGVGTHALPSGAAPAPSVNPYIDYYTYPRRVMLFDFEEDRVIESHMTTTELKERHGIDVWHHDPAIGITDRGLRLPDDEMHEKSFPVSRVLNWSQGFTDPPYVYGHGAMAHPVVAWTADTLVPPADAIYPPPPSSCAGPCFWNQSRYEAGNQDTKGVNTQGTGESATNIFRKESYIWQHDLLWRNLEFKIVPGCSPGARGFSVVVPGQPARASWICEVSAAGPVIITLANYTRFGGSYRLTTRDTYPSMNAGQVGFIQTTSVDNQKQVNTTPGGVASGGGGVPYPCPYHNGNSTAFTRTINIDVICSFGDLYSMSFNHGSYDYYNCPYEGTRGANGVDFEYPGTAQAFLGIEAGIINNKVICAITGVGGAEKIALPYIGDWNNPGKWDLTGAYKMNKVEEVIAGLHVIPLDTEQDYVDMILSANDIDYFSLSTGGAFESAVKELVERMYEDTVDDHEKNLFSFLSIESRILEMRTETTNDGVRTVYGSPTQPNPWITPKIGKPFWRPL